jgi:phage-related protein (TIGR01555 family)
MGEKTTRLTADGWANLITGLGQAATAKKLHTRHVAGNIISDQELESLFVEDGLAARIVKLLPDDMFREGWEYSFPKLDVLDAEETAEKYAAVMEALEAPQKIRDAFYWKRLYGGAIILIGVVDGMEMDKPLNPKRVKSFERLRVIDRTGIDFSKIVFQTDPARPRYGMPEFYPVRFDAPSGFESELLVHHTRVIELHGDTLPKRAMTTLSSDRRYWGISVLQRAQERLGTLGSSLGSIDQLLDEMSVGKYKVSGLADMLDTPGGKESLQRRIELMDMTRSAYRSQYFDTTEDFVRENAGFTGVSEILYIIFMLLSADTGYPITRLFGVSPGGMNATGDSDMRNYYDAVRSEQAGVLRPVILRLVRIISRWQGIEEPYIEFPPQEPARNAPSLPVR